VENELAVAYIGFMYGKDLQKYYYKLDLNNYSEFNYFYFSGKTFTKYNKGYRRTYLPDEELVTKTVTNDMIKDIRQIYFWLESDKGLNCSPASTKGLIIDDVEYFEGANGYDSTEEDAALPTETFPEDNDTTKYIAISFDDGPQVYSPTGKHFIDYYTELGEKYDAKFTHFIIGNNCGDDDLPTLKRALEKGHALENHTIGHNNLENLTLEEGKAKIKELSDWMQTNLGVTPKYLRPPYLAAESSKVYQAAEEAGIKACIAGPCPGDYDEPSVDYEALYYQRELRDGSISLMHEHYIDNVEMVRRVVEHFKARGYEFVTIDELFEIKGVEPELNKMYSVVE
ncbi:MAG: polysaccharide deacetylase family protein, partial [Clostridia bacterium]|nr:polysaccharide deacetylase family protein [Clostridia bacterium]